MTRRKNANAYDIRQMSDACLIAGEITLIEDFGFGRHGRQAGEARIQRFANGTVRELKYHNDVFDAELFDGLWYKLQSYGYTYPRFDVPPSPPRAEQLRILADGILCAEMIALTSGFRFGREKLERFRALTEERLDFSADDPRTLKESLLARLNEYGVTIGGSE